MFSFQFKGPLLSRSSSEDSSERPAKWLPEGDSKERAVAHLIQHGVLSHTVGSGIDYKVRTTIVTQRFWQYRCDVFCRDKPMRGAFSPIVVDRTSAVRQVPTAHESNEALRFNLADEAVDVHFTRCAVLREYLTLASIYSQPPLASRRRYTRSLLLVGVALLTAYGVWSQTLRTHSAQPLPRSAVVAQQAPPPVTAQIPTPTPQPVPLPEPRSMTTDDITARPAAAPDAAAPDATPPIQAPKRVLLSDLLTLGSSAQKSVLAAPADTAEGVTELTASDVHVGDRLLLTGWLHWISYAPNGEYQLYLTPTPRSRASGLIATVPRPDQPAGSPALEKQQQTVRNFITQRLLRQQKPSPRRSIMGKPIFIQLMGQLSSSDGAPREPAGGKRLEEATTDWEIRPVLDVQFATPPTSSSRSRSR
jgi:hypothetical protein